MHIDFARNTVAYYESNYFMELGHDGTQKAILKVLCVESEALCLVKKHGDEKLINIAKTVSEMKGHSRYYLKYTKVQREAISEFLLKHFGSARAAVAAMFGCTESEMFGCWFSS